ncbi:putative exocyst complex component protein [Neofusicoccum parvum UCRNP2]|uniref:Putative exocyst complex component protein n=1 Tax=Botryosphaeria parva (strain UCR-NP2) TaxID=1287680 RepID=R1GAZ4_BOTPV|nr:putative exocyst complex component protein [Neofusicoccum parvum UCRNP2]
MNGSRSHNPNGSGSSNGRAEKYEDEKRRIIESCFSKMDPNGALSESYITHLRVSEDAAHPQNPPPPSSPAQNKKPRVIIIAVRSSGRVRIHKARENTNGSFSIGKTWNMEDLSAVESFANSAAATPEQQQRKEWAGPTGFIVTLAKPYYWNANSAKEKDFFINSLIKIYGKYTSGKVPQLIGFSQKEMDMILRPPTILVAPGLHLHVLESHQAVALSVVRLDLGTLVRRGPYSREAVPGLRPNTSHSNMSRSEEPTEEKSAEAPPERKRPPMISPATTPNAYGAFKPRAGGAAQKFKAALADAPSEQKPDAETPKALEGPAPEFPAPEPKPEEQPAAEKSAEPDLPGLIVSAPTTGPEPIEPPRRSNQQAKYLASLGLDASVLDIRGLEIESILSDFGWGSAGMQPKKLEAFEADLKREIARVEAGSWLNNTDHNDERVDAVEKMLDKVIAECDELEGLLTLYNVELSSLNDDIAFIEAQSQGLQVQTANQKLLHSELQKLVDTISIDTRQLEPLRAAKISKPEGLEAIENSLLLLYKAMITIDPAIRQGAEIAEGASGMGNSELSNMRALQEKKKRYLQESAIFLKRLCQHMDMTFGAALLNTRDAIARQNAGKVSTKLDPATHDFARNALWQYSPLLLFAKEIDLQTWDNLLKMYQARARPVYQEEFRDNATAWKKMARRPTGEEQDLLFTSQEKDTETLKTTARKLTVKRSGTLARGLRSNSNEKSDKGGRLYPYEAFAGALDEMSPLVFTEQNFVVEYFHATSSENVDFADAVTSAPPHARQGSNLLARRMFEADRAMAKRVVEVMDDIFSFWPTELQNLVEFVVNSDPLQGVGILACLDRKLIEYEETNQDFLARTFQALQTRLLGLFNRFVDTQITAIEDTKVKIKKRKGVISFFKTFPHFSAAIENMIPPADDLERLEVRTMVDDAYQKINKAMFESLKVIAKESPAAMAAQSAAVGGVGADPEDKEALNYHILHIENMNHYIEEVDPHGDLVLSEWKEKAKAEMDEHMTLYIDAIIRRPLGKLLDFLDPIPTILAALPSGTPPKEIRKGIEALRKRVDKHFGDADDPGLSRNLVTKVLGECERKYQDVWQQLISVNNDIYGGEIDVGSWGDEIAGSFKGR